MSPVVVGRADQLRRLTSAVLHPPAVVVVEGEAGIGKTRLIAEMVAHPDTAGLLVRTGACRRIREPFPLGAIIEALDGAGEHLTGRLSPVTGALRGLLPELADVLPPALEPVDDRAAERHRVFRGLAGALRVLSPAVSVLEDVHWADEQTVEFLVHLLASPAGLAVVLTYRGEETGAGVREVTARVADRTVSGPRSSSATEDANADRHAERFVRPYDSLRDHPTRCSPGSGGVRPAGRGRAGRG